jgi:hypothetical protein
MIFDIPNRIGLVNLLMERTGGKVYQGPFEGMIITPNYAWGDGDTAGKLLGIYEDELYDYIEEVIESKPDLIVNFGCAEGYYGLGMHIRTGARTVLIDQDANALSCGAKNAEANKLTVETTNNNTPEYLGGLLAGGEQPFLFMDCEGYEDVILDPELVTTLKHTTIMVESHDCNIPGLTLKLTERFSGTHDIVTIPQGTKNPHTPITQDLSDEQKALIVCEFRPHTMFWLYMTPKK